MAKHIVTIIDRSGSMLHIKEDMNGGLRSWLGEVVAADPNALFTSIRFDDAYEITNRRALVSTVKPKSITIVPRGSTALNDAIMKGLAAIEDDDEALVMIVTDGMENASVEATTAQVRQRIEELEKRGVTFQYLSASPSAFADSSAYGISAGQTVYYAHNTRGSRQATASMTQSSTAFLTKDNDPQDVFTHTSSKTTSRTAKK